MKCFNGRRKEKKFRCLMLLGVVAFPLLSFLKKLSIIFISTGTNCVIILDNKMK